MTTMITRQTVMNPRLMAVLLLGFSSGLPLALTSSTLQAWFTEANVSLAAVGALSLVGIPYTLKFIWAPLMDYIHVPWVGMRKGWILLSQLGLVAALVLLAQCHPDQAPKVMYCLALLIAFLSASQDVAIDAYRTDVLKAEERGIGTSYYVFSYRIALLVSGGLALILADYFGWQVTYMAMAGFLSLSLLPAYYAPSVNEESRAPGNLLKNTGAGLADLFKRDKIIIILLFLIFYKVGDALALQLMTNFLLHGLGFTLTEVGFAYKMVSFLATILGAFVGGLILTQWSVYRGLWVFGLAQAFSNFMFVILAMVGKHFSLMALSIFIENFCSGMSTAALIAFMMSLCNRQFTATQFALLSAITSLGRVFLGPVAAVIVSQIGWVSFYAWAVVLSFPGLIFLLLLKDEVSAYAHVAAD